MAEPQPTRRYAEAYAPPTGANIRLAHGSTYQITVPAGLKIEAAEYADGSWTYILKTAPRPSSGDGKPST